MGKNCDIFLNVTEQLVPDSEFQVTNTGWKCEYTSSAHKFSQFITLYQCPEGTPACSVGWFVSLLVRLCEREILLSGSDEQCFCEGLASPAPASQPSDHAAQLGSHTSDLFDSIQTQHMNRLVHENRDKNICNVTIKRFGRSSTHCCKRRSPNKKINSARLASLPQAAFDCQPY